MSTTAGTTCSTIYSSTISSTESINVVLLLSAMLTCAGTMMIDFLNSGNQ